MKKSRLIAIFVLVALISAFCAILTVPAFAETEAEAVTEEGVETEEKGLKSTKAIAAAITIGIVGAAGAIGMAWAITKSADGMARQPEAAGKINSAMMLGLVFIETAIIYALIVAILIIFVL